MRLHRITLTDFRGVEASEVLFGAPGVTVVVGPNEIGKSSLAEALRLVRDYKSSSQHSAIKAVQPTHRDVGPQVEIELTTGTYRFVYTKRWLRKTMTELRILEPRPEQLTGDAAHERVERIFAETLDEELWSALQQVQGESLQQPQLARVAPLQSALSDLADDDASGASHEDLLDRIEHEYRRYFTATGKPTDAYAATIRELAAREEQVQVARAQVEALTAVVERHAQLTEQRGRLAERVARARAEADELAERADALVGLRRDLDDATARLSQSEVAAAGAQSAVAARSERATESAEREAVASTAVEERDRVRADHAAAVQRLTDFEAEHAGATESVAALRVEVAAAERVVRGRQARADADAVRGRLAGIDAATARLVRAEEELAANLVDSTTVQQLAEVQARLQADREAAGASAARITVERLGDSGVLLDDAAVADTAHRDVTAPVTVEVAGVVRVVITPDEGAARRTRQIEEREREVSDLLAELGVVDLAEARLRSGERDDAERRRDAARVERDTLLAGEPVEAVRARLHTLDASPSDEPAVPIEDARATLADLSTRLGDAEQVAASWLRDRDSLVADVRCCNDAKIKAEAQTDGLVAEADRAAARLAADREERDDDALAGALLAADETRATHAQALERVRAALRERDADGLDIVATNARELAKRLVDDLAVHDRALAATMTELEVRGRDGLQDKLDEALALLEDTRRVHRSLESRAGAARLLRETMATHRSTAQHRYVAPFREAVESLGAVVFGSDFGVDIDEDLSIVSRTIDGVTVPFESLSGGAREQLSIIGRLATARLVSAEDGVPVILDDSLGFTDAGRRRKLAALLNLVGQTTQIIILTCEPDRFEHIGSATTVTLG